MVCGGKPHVWSQKSSSVMTVVDFRGKHGFRNVFPKAYAKQGKLEAVRWGLGGSKVEPVTQYTLNKYLPDLGRKEGN